MLIIALVFILNFNLHGANSSYNRFSKIGSVPVLKEENLILDFYKNKGLKAVVFRFGTIFGISQGMRFHTAVNKFCWQAVMNQPISVWKTAYDQKRPYLELKDASNAFKHIINNDIFDGEIYLIVLPSMVRVSPAPSIL